jgi:predicted acylesterase/phospholipase RssA
VAGTSAGAIVGSLVAANAGAGELEEIMRGVDYRRFQDGPRWRDLFLTCRLQEVRPPAPSALAAQMARAITRTALVALGLSGASFHKPFHADGGRK